MYYLNYNLHLEIVIFIDIKIHPPIQIMEYLYLRIYIRINMGL